ncbi:MAG: hypothetical protein ACLSTO_03500 [Bilophila wadsworthia]
MPKSFYACLSAVLVLVMLAFAYGEADAARIGGGRSFGGRPSMSQPYTKPLPSNPSSSFNQQTNRQSQQMANSVAPSRGLFGGMGGMLAFAGSLLGSLLFGGGFNGGGFLDIIISAVSFSSRSSSSADAAPQHRAQDSPMRAVSTRSAARPAPIRRTSVRRLPKAARAVLTGRR